MNKKYPSPFQEKDQDKASGGATDLEALKAESPVIEEDKNFDSEQKLQKENDM